MQIPEHWAEVRLVGKVGGRDRVVRRFGWSEQSPELARVMAQQRAAAALAELQAGRPVAARERKLAYGDAGLPIREQVLARHGDLVITRNSYGARCLNEPDVLFADLDLQPRLPAAAEAALAGLGGLLGLLLFAAALYGYWHGWRPLGCSALFASLLLPALVFAARARLRLRPAVLAATRGRMLARVRRVVEQLPAARFVLYETPAGLRLLALHATYDPRAEATQRLLRAFGSDPAYMQMCALQACFRARVSGKPWRMGVRHIRPNPGIWPVHPDRLPLREQWVAEYETAAAGFAACRFVEELGAGRVQPRCAEVQRLHDELSGARSDRPLA
jgi:hypothetical protein